MDNKQERERTGSTITFWWDNPVRAAAAMLSGFVILLSTVVPISVAGRAVYDTQVALDCVIAIGALWAVVFGYENIKAFNAARIAEMTPLWALTASIGESNATTITIQNMGKGAGVVDAVQVWRMDNDRAWYGLPLPLDVEGLASGERSIMNAGSLIYAYRTSTEIPVSLTYRTALSDKATVAWFNFGAKPSNGRYPVLPPRVIDGSPRIAALSDAIAILKKRARELNVDVEHLPHAGRTEFVHRGETSRLPHSQFASVAEVARTIANRLDEIEGRKQIDDWYIENHLGEPEADK